MGFDLSPVTFDAEGSVPEPTVPTGFFLWPVEFDADATGSGFKLQMVTLTSRAASGNPADPSDTVPSETPADLSQADSKIQDA